MKKSDTIRCFSDFVTKKITIPLKIQKPFIIDLYSGINVS